MYSEVTSQLNTTSCGEAVKAAKELLLKILGREESMNVREELHPNKVIIKAKNSTDECIITVRYINENNKTQLLIRNKIESLKTKYGFTEVHASELITNYINNIIDGKESFVKLFTEEEIQQLKNL